MLGFAALFAELFDIEKFLFPIFFLHYRNLRKESLRLSWIIHVSLPFYASVGLIYWFMKASIPIDDPDEPGKNFVRSHALALDFFFTLIVPMTILVFG